MRLINVNLSILILVIILTLQPSSYNFAQNQSQHRNPESTSKRNYNLYDNSSSPTPSDASDRNYNRNTKSNDGFLDEYRRNKNEEKNYNERYEDKYSSGETRTENYFHIDRTGRTLWDGKHWKITDFPLKIYVKESSSRYYKSVYNNYVKYALDVWKKADDRINYTLVNSQGDADISLYFIEDLGEKYKEDYLGLTEYDMYGGKIIYHSMIQISLIKFDDEIVTNGEIKATIIHELGHAFGLGHSDNEIDIMYLYISPDHTSEMTYNELSIGDKEAIEDVIDLGDEEIYVRK